MTQVMTKPQKIVVFVSQSPFSSGDLCIHVQAGRISIKVVHCSRINTHWDARALFSVIRFWLRVCITILLSSRNLIFVCIFSSVIVSPCFIVSCFNVGVILPLCIRASPYDRSPLANKIKKEEKVNGFIDIRSFDYYMFTSFTIAIGYLQPPNTCMKRTPILELLAIKI